MSDRKRNGALLACCLVNLCLGSIYAWSVFSQAMSEYLNAAFGLPVTAADMAIVYTVANCIGPVTMITGGRINDALGPKRVILLGGILFGGGMMLSGFAKSIGFLMVSYGLIGGLGLGLAYGSTISTAVKLFPKRRGLVGGLTTAAYGLSAVLLPPVVSAIVDRTSAKTAFLLVGAVFLVIIVICALFLGRMEIGGGKAAPAPGDSDLTWKEMLREGVFYLMLLLLICGAFSGMMVISQASAISVNVMGFGAEQAALLVSVLALFNTAGRLLAGVLSDRIGRIGTLRLACLLSAIAQVFLLFSVQGIRGLYYVGIALVGVSFGSFMGVYPGFTADRFGALHNSVNYGIMCIGFALAGYFGPQIAKSTWHLTGSYGPAFSFALVFSAVGLILTFLYQWMMGGKKTRER